VLQAIFGQLRGNNDELVFVSESHAGELAELAIRARGAQTAQEFETTFLQAKDVREIFERLRRAWQSCDTETAWGILRRVQVRSADERCVSSTMTTKPCARLTSARKPTRRPGPAESGPDRRPT
jgi:hypothetical protein